MMSKSRIFALMLFMNTFASVCFAQSLVDVFSLRKTKPEPASFQLSKHPVHYCELQRIVGLFHKIGSCRVLRHIGQMLPDARGVSLIIALSAKAC